jgi:hypothetical protein
MTKEKALDLALEVLEDMPGFRADIDNAITAIKQARETPVQDVFWAISYDGKTPYSLWHEGDGALLDLEVARQGGTTCKMPLYTAQRTWVDLTDEEVAEGLRKPFWEDAARAIEAKLKEKNAP